MKRVCKKKVKQGVAGFTLIEVLVSLAIVSLLLVAVSGVFERSSRLYTEQNAAAALQQDIRAALDMIATEARMAAYDPTQRGEHSFSVRVADRTRFKFEADLDGNGEKALDYNGNGECENRTFRFSLDERSVQILCGVGAHDALIGGDGANVRVTGLDFTYQDRNNQPTTNLREIRGAVITIRGETDAGQIGVIERTYSTSVDFRNTGPNA